MSIEAKCHCGNIQILVPQLPDTITSCNCSICRRYGALWAYYRPEDVKLNCHIEKSVFYIWGDKEVEFHRCSLCGCVTHYVTTEKCDERIFAVNARMLAPEQMRAISVREVDGASS